MTTVRSTRLPTRLPARLPGRHGRPLAWPTISRLPRTSMVVIALATVYVVWGSTYLAISVAVTTLPPFLLMAVRFAIAGCLLYGWALRRARRAGRPVTPPTPRQWVNATVTGGMLLVGGTGLVAVSQTRITSGMAALLCATVPLWLSLFARGAFGEQLAARAWLGLAIGLAGVAVLVRPGGDSHVGWMLLALLGAMAWAAGSLRSRQVQTHPRPLVGAAMEMLGASVLFALFGLLRGEASQVDVGAISLASVAALAYLVTAGSVVAFTAYSWLVRNASTSLVGTYAYVNPVVAVLLGWAVLQEPVTGRTVVAGAIILVAVVLLVTSRNEPVPAQPTSGADVYAGSRRFTTVRQRLGRLPRRARLYLDPGAPQYRPVRREEQR